MANVDGQHGQDLEGYTTKARAYHWFELHSKDLPYRKIKKLAAFLGIKWTKNSPEVLYLYQLHKDWKVDFRFGLGSKGSNRDDREQHHVYACVFVPKSLDRNLFSAVSRQALESGWVESRNRNHCLIWNRDPVLGRGEWQVDGRVRVHCTKPQRLDKVLTLLGRAFGSTGLIADDRILAAFLDRVDWVQGVNVYSTKPKKRMPYLKITDFENLGIKSITSGDLSHPYSIEVEWCKPRWNEKVEAWLEVNAREHVDLRKFITDLSSPRSPAPNVRMTGVV